jgi:KDO2-lipid IV(A) lauroyltransferase
MLKNALSRVAVAVFWLLHLMPQPLLARLGRGVGLVLYRIGGRRRRIAETNLAWCFPELDAGARARLARAHFQALGRTLLERSILWWGSHERVARLCRLAGAEKIRDLLDAGRPIILLAPHFVGLDVGGAAVAMNFDCASMYSSQSNPVFDRLLLRGRLRFGDQVLLSRKDGARASLKALKSGRPFYYLPDMNFHRRDSIFVPFFGIQTSTITGLSRLAKATGAAVLPCATRMLPGDAGYVVEIGDAWTDYPTEDVEADTARMNAWIESAVRTMPEQYFWVHRRFKTRPPGEAKPY